MGKLTFTTGLMVALIPLGASGAAARAKEQPHAPAVDSSWPGEEMPLPLTVRTPDDLVFKETAEHQYLIFNLLASGKLAYDRGDMATAATKWETLLRVPNLPADLDRVIRPLAIDARQRAGGVAAELPPEPAAPSATAEETTPASTAATTPSPARVRHLSLVRGFVTGGGSLGAGGTVVWLKRRDGATPQPRPSRGKTISQKGKKFIPRVLAVPVGTTVYFRNDDEVYHNVFSLSHPNEFDLGLYQKGISRNKTFNTAGPVDLLCNIHSSMSAYIYVVDSPYYAQADRRGNFAIRGVPPGKYTLRAWHETSLEPTETQITVKDEVMDVAVTVTSDRPTPAFVPDKAGKPRQAQLGY
jgi:plastocyanin